MFIQLLLVSVLLLAFVSPFSSSREFSGFTPHIGYCIMFYCCEELVNERKWWVFPFNFFK